MHAFCVLLMRNIKKFAINAHLANLWRDSLRDKTTFPIILFWLYFVIKKLLVFVETLQKEVLQ